MPLNCNENQYTYGVFISTKKCALYLKTNAILGLFLINISPSKRMVCFILKNLPLSNDEGHCILCPVLIESADNTLCKADDYRATRSNLKKVPWYRYTILKLIFSLLCGVTLKMHYFIKAIWSVK